jgi:hypothetical protein
LLEGADSSTAGVLEAGVAGGLDCATGVVGWIAGRGFATGAICSARDVGCVTTGFGGLIGATDGVDTLLLEPVDKLASLEFGLARLVWSWAFSALEGVLMASAVIGAGGGALLLNS